MELYLLRHGIAEDWATDGSDASRRLTGEGIAKLREIARGLRRLEVRPDAILSSPLVRARETAEIVGHVLRVAVQITEPLAPGCGVGQLLRVLDGYTGARALIVVGHEPDMGYLIGAMTGGPPLPLKKGGMARIDLAQTEAGAGTLTWLLPPKILRALGA
jgi:phosphohistidine phosphatase